MCLDVPSCTLICVLYPAICQDQSECDDFFYSFSFLNHHNATEISNSEDCWKRERYQDMIFDLWLQFCAWLQERIPIDWRGVPTTPVHKRRTLFRRSRGTFQVVWPQQTWRELLKFDNFWKLYHHMTSKSFEFQQGSQWHLATLVVLFLKRVSELLLFDFLTSIFVLVT